MTLAGNQPLHEVRLLAAYERRFAALQAQVFRQQRQAFLEASDGVLDSQALITALAAAQSRTRELQESWYRRTYVTVGASFAARDTVKSRRAKAPGEAPKKPWGPKDNPWWREDFVKELGEEPWWPAWLAATLAYVEATMGSAILDLDRTGLRQAQAAILTGVAAGLAVAKIREAIAKRMSSWGQTRSVAVAKSEVATAARQGAHQAVVIQAPTKRWVKSWRDTGDPKVRRFHREATRTNKDVPVDEPFLVKNSQGVLQRLMFPGDRSLGADASNTVNCRCDSVVRVQRS